MPTASYKGPFCDAPRIDAAHKGKTCKNFAGFRTNHPGVGRCFKHGGNVQKKFVDNLTLEKKNGRYSGIQHRGIAEVMEQLANQQEDVMDLIPEANLLRAMIVDYINRYDLFVDALMAWYNDPHSKMRPRKVMDISDCVTLIEGVSRIVHRYHQIQSEGSITLETFRRVMEQMGIIVASNIADEAVLKRIEQQWSRLVIDSKAPSRFELPEGAADEAIDAEFTTTGESNEGQEQRGRDSRPVEARTGGRLRARKAKRPRPEGAGHPELAHA